MNDLTAQLLATLESKGLKLAVAESLTGGLLAAEFTSVAGASNVFLGGIVAYQSALKHELLGVSASLLDQRGAVDAEVAAQMAAGVRERLAEKCGIDPFKVIGLSTTGVAGPDEQDGKSVGTVFAGVASSLFADQVLALNLDGGRQQIRQATVDQTIAFLWEQISTL